MEHVTALLGPLGHALLSIAATSPADCEWSKAVLGGLGGANLGNARTPGPGVEVPKVQPVTKSCRDASAGVMRRFGSHLENKE